MAYQPKSYRKFLATSLSAAVVASAGVGAGVQIQSAEAAESFSDVSTDYWASGSIQRLADQGIINGYKDGTYGPGEEINRGQVSELLVRAFGLEVDENAAPPFEDLSEESYYTPYAAAVSEAGYIEGRENGTQFAAGMDLSREQLATILVRAFELEAPEGVEADVNDLDEAHESHQGNIEILAQYDITSTADGNFRPKETVDRAQFAVFLERALAVEHTLEAGIAGVRAVDKNTVDVSFNQEITEDDISAEDFSFDPELEVLDAEIVEVEESEFSASNIETVVRLTTADQEAGVDYDLYYQDSLTSQDLVGFEEEPSTEPEAVEVNEVTTDNLRSIAVNFNQDVSDIEGVEDAENYELDSDDTDATIDNVTVDGETAYLWLDTTAGQQDEATVTVSDSILEEAQEFGVTFFDATIPTAESAEVVGNNTIKVDFSEAIDPDSANAGDAFSLEDEDGSTYNVSSAEFENNNTTAYVEFFSDLEEKQYTFTVNGGEYEDYADFSVAESEFTLDVELDEEAPEIVGTRSVNQQHAVIEFNEDIIFAEGDAREASAELVGNIYHTNSSNGADSAEIRNGNELHVFFSANNNLPNGTANLYVDGETVQDLWDNVLEEQVTATVDVEFDAEAPSIVNVEQDEDSQNSFTVTFDDEVEQTSAENEDNYVVTDEDGEEVSIANIARDAEDTEQVTVTLNEDIYGAVTLDVQAVEDAFGNEMGEVTETFEMADLTAPDVNAFSGSFNVGSETTTILFDFDDTMATSGEYAVNDLSKYTIEDDQGNDVALDDVESANLEVVQDGTQIEITFDNSELSINSTPTFRGSRVADAEGNRISDLTFSEVLTDISSATVGYEEITILDEDTVEVQFDQNLDVYDENDFTFTDGSGGSEVIIASSNQVAEDTVVFNIGEDVNTDGTLASGNYLHLVTDGSGDTANRFGQSVTSANVALNTADTTNNISEEIGPEINSVTTTGTDTIEVEFTEAVEESLVNRTTFDVEGYSVASVTSTSGLGGGYETTYELTIENEDGTAATLATDETPAVTVADASDIIDAYENAYDVDSEIPGTEDGIAGTISSAATTQTAAGVSFTAGDSDDEVTVTLADENGTNLLGAYGNEFDVVVADGSTNDPSTTASIQGNTITVELADNGTSPTANVSDVVSAIEGIDGVTASVTSDADNTDDAAIAVSSQSLTGGEDSIAVDFTDAYDASTIDTSDVNTDFNFNTATVTGTSATTDADTVTLTISVSDNQLVSDSVNVIANEIDGEDGNPFDTTPETIN